MSVKSNIFKAVVTSLLAWSFSTHPASAMELKILDKGLPLQVQLVGEIHPGDAQHIIRELENARPAFMATELASKAPLSFYDPRQWLWVDVESPGGDVEESLVLGRYLHSANTLVTTKQQCISACVLLLAGAVERVGLGSSGAIGIHRPYPTDARGSNQESLDKLYSDLHAKIAGYLQDMHVPTLLLEMMFATPPEEMRVLSPQELAIFLPQRDPAWDELSTSRRATFDGLPSALYREKRVEATTACRGSQVTAGDQDQSQCRSPSALAVHIDELAAEQMLFSGRCATIPGWPLNHAGNSDYLSCFASPPRSDVIVQDNSGRIRMLSDSLTK